MITSILSLCVLVFAFGVLIFVHELGHFLAAKWAGIRTEGFAIGMGPVVASWRKGVGLRAGSTDRPLVSRFGRTGGELTDDELREHGIGETEYSLRALPVGGFVKMLGQEDGKPVTESSDPRSYGACPVWKRMIVVSAGVIMNILLAFVLFAVAFHSGVRSPAPIIGYVMPGSPAQRAVAANAQALGVSETGLLPGDRVLSTDGDEVRTFSDLTIAAAMSKPGAAVAINVERDGVAEPLEFSIVAERTKEGLLSFGLGESRSTTLYPDQGDALVEVLEDVGLAAHGVVPGMRLVEAEGVSVADYPHLERLAGAHGGGALMTTWSSTDPEAPATVTAPLDVVARFENLGEPGTDNWESGLLGFVPLVRVQSVEERTRGVLRLGDLMLRTADLEAPRVNQMVDAIQAHEGGMIDLLVLRDGEAVDVEASVDTQGRVGFSPEYAFDVPRIAARMLATVGPSGERPTAASNVDVPPGAEILSVAEHPIQDWYDFRAALLAATETAHRDGTGARIPLAWRGPTAMLGEDERTVALPLTADDVARLHDLGWKPAIRAEVFQAQEILLSAGGNPLRAVAMGLQETHKVITLTYLTIDRLFRGSVGVDQLRGPVGIIDLGTRILPRGLMYFLFFQGLISVNLAVINFLPLPIVDGGLFLFLVYEQFKGKPPSIRFQNVTTVAGLCLIGVVFVVTFYNDIMRIIQG